MRFRIGILAAAATVGVALAGCGAGEKNAGPGWLTCFGYGDPTNTFRERALKHQPGAENIDAAPNRLLKKQIGAPAAENNGFARPDFARPGWIELESTPTLVKFGLPSKPWGIVAQADVMRKDDSWKITIRQCILQKSTPDRLILTLTKPIEGFGDPRTRAVRISTSHDLDACDPTRPAIALKETSTRIVLTATYPWDAEKKIVRGMDNDDCAGTGNTRTYTVKLREPLGSRAVRQGGYVPNRILESWENGSFAAGPPAFPIKTD